MAEWDVVNQAPAPEFEDRWAPVQEEVAQDPWTPVQQTLAKPLGSTRDPRTFKEQLTTDLGKPQGILRALVGYPTHFVKTLLETPQHVIEASEGLRTTGELSPEGAGDIMS